MNLVVQVSCLLLWIATGSYAQNHLQHGHEQLRLGVSKPPHPLKKVAIIGAGSAGTSTAHYLSRYAAANVTIFERNSWIGGRSTTVDAYGDPSQPVELGASIFVEANLNLVQAVKDLNLTTNHLHAHDDGATGRIGIYDGSRFVYEADLAGTSYWDLAKLFWRYGLSPYRAQKLMKRVVGQLLTMYDAPIFPFTSLSQAAYDVGLTAVTAATGAQYLRENEVGDLFSNEIVQAATRVNYAQNLNEIHGLEALVCLAADNAKSVVGGNWKIFAGMAKSSTVLLDTEVHSISSKHGGSIRRGRPRRTLSSGRH
ncbi:hypothetical protein FH972_026209 [Carpinus fangiana]|uniref:Prenylcysteine lyase domain-containing protein n=1 Tax=Carpinus fangiana TaxID=176857 RepID=A0A5N6L3C7_9ROSI|nr:hypothetical protein FH972_026209 [Carpinus fangiana]